MDAERWLLTDCLTFVGPFESWAEAFAYRNGLENWSRRHMKIVPLVTPKPVATIEEMARRVLAS